MQAEDLAIRVQLLEERGVALMEREKELAGRFKALSSQLKDFYPTNEIIELLQKYQALSQKVTQIQNKYGYMHSIDNKAKQYQELVKEPESDATIHIDPIKI